LTPWYIATEKFGPQKEGWSTYLAGSGLRQLDEVVTLDILLCPPILRDIKDHYWPHIVNEDFMLNFFTDFAFLIREAAETTEKNVLGVYRNPTAHPPAPAVAKFEFIGYDLVDIWAGNSALTNCGGFPKAFSNGELSSKGLLTSWERAVEVQNSLREHYPEEDHANCHVWTIYRAVGL
jgi:hypothetical protein